MAWTLLEPHHDKLRTKHHRMLPPIIGPLYSKNTMNGTMLNRDVHEKTKCGNIATTVSTPKPKLWVGFAERTNDLRSPRCVMLATLADNQRMPRGRPERTWTHCPEHDLETFGTRIEE